jgi:4-hydroxy-tetrahydrodipicolinate synthase
MKIGGCYTALATPFRGEKVDFASLGKLVEHQVAGGVAGVVPCGTTGESPTLTEREHEEVIAFVVRETRGRCAVIAGTGSNSTAVAAARAALLVTPYYNRPTQEGLFRHYEAIARAAPGFPLWLYEIPSRTGVSLDVETCARLSAVDGVVAIKEASGKPERTARLRSATRLDVLSGDDALTLPILALGGCGVVSVVSNVVPAEVVALVAAALRGDRDDAMRRNERIAELTAAMFAETNPSPVKEALARRGLFASAEVRLPLVPVSPATRARIERALAELG